MLIKKYRVTASVAGIEDDFINSYNDNFNTFSDYQSLKIITRSKRQYSASFKTFLADIDSKQDISNDNFVSNNNNNSKLKISDFEFILNQHYQLRR